MNAVPLAPATVRPFVPHVALRDELGLARDRFGAETASFARTHDGRYLVGAAARHLVVLFADGGEVAWWAPLPSGVSPTGGVTMLPDDVAVLVVGRELLGVAIATGTTAFRVANLGADVTAVRAAPDDPRCLYIGGARNLARLVDPYTHDTRWDLLAADPAWGEAREAVVSDLAVSADGRWLLTVRPDACHLWDTHTRQRVRRIAALGDHVALATLVPGHAAFLVTARGRMHLVDLATGDTLAERQLEPGLRVLPPLAVSRDGARVAFGGNDGALHVIALPALAERPRAFQADSLRGLLPDGDGWLALTYGGRVQRLRADDGEAPAEAAVFRGAATALRLTDDTVAITRHGGGVERIHLETRAATVALPRRPVQALSPSARWALVGGVRVDLASGAEEPFVRGDKFAVDDAGRWVSASTDRVTFGPGGCDVTVPALDKVQEVLLSPDGERAFVLYARSKLLVVDRAAGVVAAGPLPVAGPMVALDGARLAVWDHRAALTVYDAVAGAVTLKAKAPKRGAGVAFTCLAAHPAAGLLVGGGADGTACLVDLTTGAPRARWSVGAGPVRAVAFSADGARVATSADDPFVRTWEAAALLATPIATGRYKVRRQRSPRLA